MPDARVNRNEERKKKERREEEKNCFNKKGYERCNNNVDGEHFFRYQFSDFLPIASLITGVGVGGGVGIGVDFFIYYYY